MNSDQPGAGAGQGRRGNPRPHRPQDSPVKAFAWALVGLRKAKDLSLRNLGHIAGYDSSVLSRMTAGETLPGQTQVEKYVAGCGAETAPWLALLSLAQTASRDGAAREDLESFAQALVARCTTDLTEISGAELGDAAALVAAWRMVGEAPDSGAGPGEPTGPEEIAEPEKGATGARPETSQPPRRRTRWKIPLTIGITLVLIAAGAAYLASGGGDTPKPSGVSGLDACSHPVKALTIASSTDKSGILTGLANDYGARLSHGQCVKVTVNSIDSGTAMRALASGWNTVADGPSPDVWSPASNVWLQIARHRAVNAQLRDRLPQSAGPSIVTSPLTIAMPEPAAKKLGWPGKKISWQDLSTLASRPGFKLGKTNPEYSTSGLNATFASFYAQTGTSSELSTANLHDSATQQKVRTIEKSVVHYGDTTLTYLANLRRYDEVGQASAYVSAVTVEENSVIAYNMGYPCGVQSDEPGCAKTSTRPHTKLVAFHPTSDDNVGTIYSDHPYITLNGLSGAKKDVAADFKTFLTSKTAQDAFAALGFRTHAGGLTPRITPDNGVLREQLPRQLGQPSDDVLDDLLTVWRQLRKPANVLLLIDTSGSMDWNAKGKRRVVPSEPSKLDLVKKAHSALLDGFTDTDKVGLWHFSDQHETDEKIAPMGSTTSGGKTQRQHLEADVDALKPGGGTALYATTDDAVKSLRDNYANNAINAVVVLTDGCNQTQGGPVLEEVTGNLANPSKPAVRVFTIAYGGDACRDELQEIAEASDARAYDAKDPNTIDNVLTNVISNF